MNFKDTMAAVAHFESVASDILLVYIEEDVFSAIERPAQREWHFDEFNIYSDGTVGLAFVAFTQAGDDNLRFQVPMDWLENFDDETVRTVARRLCVERTMQRHRDEQTAGEQLRAAEVNKLRELIAKYPEAIR